MNTLSTTYADLLIKNGKIYTVDINVGQITEGKYDFPIYENGYVAAKNGQTISVGKGEGDSFIGPDTQVIDAGGKVVIPGMVDSHLHAMFAGVELLGINFEKVKNKEGFLELITERVDQTPKGEWIKGSAWNEMVWKIKDMPNRHDLDKITTEHPIYCIRLCHHVYVVNSMALELAGIDRNTPDPEGGSIGRDQDGEPNGLLYENSAMGLIDEVVPPLTEGEMIESIERIGKILNRNGLTSCIDANLSVEYMRAYLQAYKSDRLSYRANLMFYLDKAWGDMAYHLKRIEEMTAVTGFGNDMLKMNAIKVSLDGIPATGTAAMRKNYDHMPETAGELIYSRDEMIEMGKLAGKNKWQIGIHCCGDKSADVAMDTFEAALKASGDSDARHYIIHMTFTHPDQTERLKELNVPLAVQPTINLQMGEQAVIGDRLSSLYMLFKTAFDNGIIVGGSSDFPVVTCNPFEGMYGAITRKSASGELHLPHEALTAQQALIMWTKNSAYFSHDDDKLGSIKTGYLSDYVIIDTPLLEAAPEEIRNTKVLKTIVGGKIVYSA